MSSYAHETWTTFYFILRLLKQPLDVISNICWKKDDWVVAVYNNEWYPGVVVEVGWILAYIIDKMSCD